MILDPSDYALFENISRRVAREEIASLSGMMLRRLQDMEPPEMAVEVLSELFGEALRDFGATGGEPGA